MDFDFYPWIPRKRELCYTFNMDADRQIWQEWVHFLQQRGMTEGVASLLEATGPMAFLGAQVAFVSEPLFAHTAFQNHLSALARLLDDNENLKMFIHFLREAAVE